MPLTAKNIKWNVFRLVCYLQIAASTGFLIFFLMRRPWPLRFEDLTDLLLTLLFVLVCCTYTANGLSNLYLIERFLPDQLPSKRAFRLNMLLYVMIIISSAMVILVTFVLYVDEDGKPDLPLLMITTLSVTSILVWFLQPDLRNTLRRNYYRAFDQFLEAENP